MTSHITQCFAGKIVSFTTVIRSLCSSGWDFVITRVTDLILSMTLLLCAGIFLNELFSSKPMFKRLGLCHYVRDRPYPSDDASTMRRDLSQ